MGVERDVRAEETEGQRHIRSTGEEIRGQYTHRLLICLTSQPLFCCNHREHLRWLFCTAQCNAEPPSGSLGIDCVMVTRNGNHLPHLPQGTYLLGALRVNDQGTFRHRGGLIYL